MNNKQLKKFNTSFKRFLFSRKVISLLDGYGWNDGGCWALATAIINWSNESAQLGGVWRMYREQPIIQHLVAFIPQQNLYLDADGFLSSHQLIHWKMEEKEMAPDCYLAPVTIEKILEQGQIELDASVANELVKRFQQRFGDFSNLLQ